ncbi:MAG: ROK family protein [Alphaproteobacteria bacterium]
MTAQPDRILADIGGTNARFALASATGITVSKVYLVRRYPRLTDALRTFVAEACGGVTVRRAALAVAGVKLGTMIRPTNSDWVCDQDEIAKYLGLESDQVTIVNDFAAVAWALNGLKPADVTVLQAGQKSAIHPMLVMGPGTGLGMAALVPHDRGWTAVAAEAGHTRYAPANNDERNLVDQIARKHIFVTPETLISGPGLVNIYRALSAVPDVQVYEPADVVARARAGEAQAHEALRNFAAIFGSFASTAALHYLALGGIYLTGGVLQKIGADFAVDRFLQRFNTNPLVSDILQRMPVLRVEVEIPAFAGLQLLLAQHD